MKETNSLLTLVICLMMLLTISLPLTMIVKLASGDIGSYADDYTTRSSLTLRPTEDRPEWQDAKMHYPQLPDPDGWDVRDMCFFDGEFYAYFGPLWDDWMCSESGNVTGIHWWGSWMDDVQGTILGFRVEIFSDNPIGINGYSIPNVLLWSNYFFIDDIVVTPETPSLQGWFEPDVEGMSYYEPGNHVNYSRYDLENITDPFYQENGTIYWLSVFPEISYDERGPSGWWGWKTSGSIQWNDCAVFDSGYDPPIPSENLYKLVDPLNVSLDLAFVITGEWTYLYVDQQYNASTPGWGVTHFATIQSAVNIATSGNTTIYVNGDGDIYDENVVIDAKSIDVFGNYTTSRPRINGQSATKSTVAIMSDWVNFSGFYVYNNIGKASYHGIAVGFISGRLEAYYNVTISDCYITTATAGVLLRSGGDCIVQTSEFPTALTTGVQISAGGLRNIIRNCSMHNIQTGIDVQSSTAYTQIYGNNIYSTTTRGLYLNGHMTNGQTIYENNFTSNLVGITVASGRTNNLIYHNNFASNTNHVTFVNNANLNFWNLSYPYCGNYWSSHGTQDIYGGPDQDIAGSDLICDLHSPDPKTVGGVNIDNYPFLNLFNGTLPSFSYPPVQSNEVPVNGTTQSELTAQVSIDVNDTEGDTFDISIHGIYLINISLNDQTNGTFSANLTIPLPYDTDIWWYVDILDSEGTWINASYYFHTNPAGNLPPDKPTNENPANNSDYVPINSYLSVIVTDPEGDMMDVIFYWANGTEIGVDWTVINGSTAGIYLPDYVWLSHDTEYSWYAVAYDTSLYSNTSDTWNFTTCKNYDLNGDGTINYLDVSSLVSQYGETLPDATQMITLRPIADTIVTWTASPPLPAHFLTVMEIIPDDINTYVFENPPAIGPELFMINAPSYIYSIINVTVNARMSSLAGGGADWFLPTIWDGVNPFAYDIPTLIMTPFPIFQTYPSSTWIGDPYGGDWTWAKLQIYHFGVDQTGVPFVSPTMMTQFSIAVYYTTPGSESYDINGDGIVNYLDVSSLVSHYGESY